MEHRITHACGHEQAHFIPGYPDQQLRKARWLRTTTCRGCFVASRRAVEAEAAAADEDAIGELMLTDLSGSERQVVWAASIRAKRLAAMMRTGQIGKTSDHPCFKIDDAKWWIDHRDASDGDLIRIATGLAIQAVAEGDMGGVRRAA